MAPLKQAAAKAGPVQVKEFVQELKNGTQDAKAAAARMLGAIAMREPPPAAPGASSSGASSSSEQASSKPSATADMLVRGGVVGPLVALVAQGADEGQIAAASTLAAIAAAGKEYQEAIAAANGVRPSCNC
jgi:hypothetical protein